MVNWSVHPIESWRSGTSPSQNINFQGISALILFVLFPIYCHVTVWVRNVGSSDPIDPGDRVATGCGNESGSQFVVTGNGGLPPNPTTHMLGQTVWLDTRELAGVSHSLAIAAHSEDKTERQLTEARGWAVNPQGQVVLTETVADNAPLPNLVCAELDGDRPTTR